MDKFSNKETKDDTPLANRSQDDLEAKETFVKTGKLPLSLMLKKGIQSLLFDPCLLVVRHLPGPIGFKLRQLWYRLFLGAMGKGCVIDVGVSIPTPKNVFLDDFVYIDQYCQLISPEGYIKIGKRCHMAFGSIVLGHKGVEIGDYTAIGGSIYSISDTPGDGKRISGPMVPMSQRNLKGGKVTIGKDAFVARYSVVLPGVTIGEGAVVGANSVVIKDVAPWTVVMGIPAKPIGKRDPVSQPDPDFSEKD